MNVSNLPNCFYIRISRRILGTFFVYILYIFVGSLAFFSIEATDTREENYEAESLAEDIVETLQRRNFSIYEIHETLLMREILIKHEIHSEDYLNYGWHVHYGAKVYFSFVLITSAGYGNVYPSSALGQIVCIIYIMIGRPGHLLMARLLSLEFRSLLRKLIIKAQSFRPDSKWIFTFAVTIFYVWWLSIFIFIPSGIFMVVENWAYHTAVYYSFMTLTTTAFGDYVAGISSDHYDDVSFSFNVIIMFIWMFFGIAFIFMIRTLLSFWVGNLLLNAVDSHCQRRAIARRKMRQLSELFTELNWQLVKYKPENFHHWKEIENFKDFLTTDPENITEEKMKEIFEIVIDLKMTAFHQLSNLQVTATDHPSTAIIGYESDDLSDILSKESIAVIFNEDHTNYPTDEDSTESYYGSASKISIIEIKSAELEKEASKLNITPASASDSLIVRGSACKDETASGKDEQLKTILHVTSDEAESEIKEASQDVEQNQQISLAEVNEADTASGKDEADAIKKPEDETESESAGLEDSSAKSTEKSEKEGKDDTTSKSP